MGLEQGAGLNNQTTKRSDGVDYDYKGDPMFEVQADNGWPGDAWASELEKHDG